MNLQITEVRYSLNGISESQLNSLFELVNTEPYQIIFKRISDPRFTLSDDDMMFRGSFSTEFITTISQIFPPPLSVKIRNSKFHRDMFDNLSSRKWESDDSSIFAGNTILPISSMMQALGLQDVEMFLYKLLVTPLGSELKPFLITKPKGLIEAHDGKILITFPFHRLDFIISWLSQVMSGAVTIDWLSGSTNELQANLIGATGELNLSESVIPLVELKHDNFEISLNQTFKRALKIII